MQKNGGIPRRSNRKRRCIDEWGFGRDNIPEANMVRNQRRRSNIRPWGLGGDNIPDLPLDIIIDIISRFPVKLIICCKSLSKPINKLLEDPSFTQVFRANNSDYFHAIFTDKQSYGFSLDLLEFHKGDLFNTRKRKHINEFNKVTLRTQFSFSSMWGNCNGLFCYSEMDSVYCDLFVTNPILGELIQLPKSFVYRPEKMDFYAYGLGYCQLSNRYKVLRTVSRCTGDGVYKNCSEIITIGIDQNWRIISDVNVLYNLRNSEHHGPYKQMGMVAFGSALHWLVQPCPMSPGKYVGYICAFDMTEEKVSALPFPLEVAKNLPFHGKLCLLLDKLCLWQDQMIRGHGDVYNLWVMDDYGVDGSWTKRFVLKMSTLPNTICVPRGRYKPSILTLSPEGLGVVTDGEDSVSYDFKKKVCLKLINQAGSPNHFVPNFASISQSC